MKALRQKEKASMNTLSHVSGAITDIVTDGDVSEVSRKFTDMVDAESYVPEKELPSLY